MLPCAALIAVAGGCSTAPPPEPIVRTEFVKPTLPPLATQPCPVPVRIPDRDVPAGEVTTLWAKDRAALRSCEARRKAAVSALL